MESKWTAGDDRPPELTELWTTRPGAWMSSFRDLPKGSLECLMASLGVGSFPYVECLMVSLVFGSFPLF